MLPAKLFVWLSVVFAVCTGIAWLKPGMFVMNIHVHDIYFLFSSMLVLLYCAVTSLNFAVLYYAAERFFHARWNRTLSVLHFCFFLCFGISFFVLFAASESTANGNATREIYWIFVPWLLGMFSFAVGFLLFAINLVLTVTKLLLERIASH